MFSGDALIDILKSCNLPLCEAVAKKRMENFADRWNSVYKVVQEQFFMLENASKNYGDFKGRYSKLLFVVCGLFFMTLDRIFVVNSLSFIFLFYFSQF